MAGSTTSPTEVLQVDTTLKEQPEYRFPDSVVIQEPVFPQDFLRANSLDNIRERPDLGIVIPSVTIQGRLKALEKAQLNAPQPEFSLYRVVDRNGSWYSDIYPGGQNGFCPRPSVSLLSVLTAAGAHLTDIAHTHPPGVKDRHHLRTPLTPNVDNSTFAANDLGYVMTSGLERLWLVALGGQRKALCLVNPHPGHNSLTLQASKAINEYQAMVSGLRNDQYDFAIQFMILCIRNCGLRLYQAASDYSIFTRFSTIDK